MVLANPMRTHNRMHPIGILFRYASLHTFGPTIAHCCLCHRGGQRQWIDLPACLERPRIYWDERLTGVEDSIGLLLEGEPPEEQRLLRQRLQALLESINTRKLKQFSHLHSPYALFLLYLSIAV